MARNTGSMGRDIMINYKDNLVLGDGSTFNDRCWINARFGITIGRNCLFGPNVLIHSANHVIKQIDIGSAEGTMLPVAFRARVTTHNVGPPNGFIYWMLLRQQRERFPKTLL